MFNIITGIIFLQRKTILYCSFYKNERDYLINLSQSFFIITYFIKSNAGALNAALLFEATNACIDTTILAIHTTKPTI